MNSMFAISSSRSVDPRVDGLEKWLCTRFFSDFALPT
jgi:hypothetical protein